MITVQEESFVGLQGEVDALLKAHWLEVANYKESIPLEPDWARYSGLEANGDLVCLTARLDGVLIGYSVFLLYNHLHYASTRCACNDIIYVTPTQRGTGAGLKLIKNSEKYLKALGVKRVNWHVKPIKDFTPILKRLGYIQEEVVMGKYIGE
ncbi:NAT_SF domain containing protein [uncultured Caudovirales phage]|uniref:NAT_SF domain containing protein n=1 Tax=uncultured Caudovirales phage TaxID=2100421 RepID=A0A6J5T920_9CAUD|nr:NAT_SF domain containing protein [uncultured Caudovirales phage]